MLTSAWARHFDTGLGFLARHKPMEAVKSLQKALEFCPPSRSQELYRVCFYLGIGLRRLGFSQSAIKSWISCQRLNKRGPTRKMLSRFTNCYGMERQETTEADDWQAFSSIQTARYLMGKNKRTFSTLAEQDMIGDLIRDSWCAMRKDSTLEGKSGCEKLEAFRSVHIVFPSVVLAEPHNGTPVIAVNFHTQKKVALNDRCSCGSGLPFILCCGRTPGKEELLSGIF
jgi:hypothetical protein